MSTLTTLDKLKDIATLNKQAEQEPVEAGSGAPVTTEVAGEDLGRLPAVTTERPIDTLGIYLTEQERRHISSVLSDLEAREESSLRCNEGPEAETYAAEHEALKKLMYLASDSEAHPECHGLDTPERVCFYEQDFYPLSNFSAFALRWKGQRFDTSEHAYHFEKFRGIPSTQKLIFEAPSAHEAFKTAELYRSHRLPEWDAIKVDIMRQILWAKVEQHEYVRRKLLATGDRELVENSWRDSFWGWGPNRDGQNQLGKLWMEIRAELRTTRPTQEG